MPYWKIYDNVPHHKVRIPWKISTNIPHNWFDKNIKGNWWYKGDEYRFSLEEDAFLVRITWLF